MERYLRQFNVKEETLFWRLANFVGPLEEQDVTTKVHWRDVLNEDWHENQKANSSFFELTIVSNFKIDVNSGGTYLVVWRSLVSPLKRKNSGAISRVASPIGLTIAIYGEYVDKWMFTLFSSIGSPAFCLFCWLMNCYLKTVVGCHELPVSKTTWLMMWSYEVVTVVF